MLSHYIIPPLGVLEIAEFPGAHLFALSLWLRKEELTMVSKISQGGYGTVYRGVLETWPVRVDTARP